MGITFGNQDCIDPGPILEACVRDGLPVAWWGKPNNFTCTLGALPGEGWVILERGSLARLSMNTLYDFVVSAKDSASGKSYSVRWKNLLMVGAECLFAGKRSDPAAPFLVKLADRRWLAQAVPIDRAYNIRSQPGSAVYYSATLNGGTTPWTWAQMVGDIWTAVGKLGTFPGLPFTPNGTPEGFDFYGSPSAMQALGIVLDRLSCALRLDPTQDTFSVVQIGAVDAVEQNALAARDGLRAWDEDPLEGVRAAVPSKVRVQFPKSRATPDTTGASPYYFLDQTDPTATGALSGTEANTAFVIYDDMPAVYDSTGTLTNSSALASRAAERAKDYFRRVRLARFHRIYGAPLADQGLLPGAQVKATRIGDKGRGAVTELAQFPGIASGAPFAAGGNSSYEQNDYYLIFSELIQYWQVNVAYYSWQWNLNYLLQLLYYNLQTWLSIQVYVFPIILGQGGYLVQGPLLATLASGTTNNFDTQGYSWVIFTSAGGAATLTGIKAPTPTAFDVGGNTVFGRLLEISNFTSQVVTLSLQDAGSIAGNRLEAVGSGNADGAPATLVLRPDETVFLKYYVGSWPNPAAANFWQVLIRLPRHMHDGATAGTAIGSGVTSYRSGINCVAGTNMTIVGQDDHVNDLTHLTFNSSAGTGFGATESGIGLLGSDQAISFAGTTPSWTGTTCSVTLPTAGATYMLMASVDETYQIASASQGGMLARMQNTTRGVTVGQIMTAVAAVVGTGGGLTGPTNTQFTCNAVCVARYTTVGANEVVRVEGNAIDESPNSYLQAKVNGSGNANTSIMFWRVA